MPKLLNPANDRVLIKPIDEGKQTYGSIVIPDIGSLRIDFDGEEYYITRDSEILAVVKESNNE